MRLAIRRGLPLQSKSRVATNNLQVSTSLIQVTGYCLREFLAGNTF